MPTIWGANREKRPLYLTLCTAAIVLSFLPMSKGFALRLYPSLNDPADSSGTSSGRMRLSQRNVKENTNNIPHIIDLEESRKLKADAEEDTGESSPSSEVSAGEMVREKPSWVWLPKPGLPVTGSLASLGPANRDCWSYEACKNLLIRYLQSRVAISQGSGKLFSAPLAGSQTKSPPNLRSLHSMIVVRRPPPPRRAPPGAAEKSFSNTSSATTNFRGGSRLFPLG